MFSLVIKEKEVSILIKQRAPRSLPSSPARHVEEIIITKSGSSSKSKPRVKIAWGNEQGTSGFDGLIGELDYDNYDSQGITPVTHTEQPSLHTNKYADRESSLDVLQEIFAKTKRRKCNFCEKNCQRAERYQAERNDSLYDIERHKETIQKLENELKDSNFYATYYQEKCEETNQTMNNLTILYNKTCQKLNAAEDTIEDLKQNFEKSEHSRLQIENHTLHRTISNLKAAVDEQTKIKESFEEKLKDSLKAIDEDKQEVQRYKKARNEDKVKYDKVVRKNEDISRQLESIRSEKDELRNQLQKSKHSAEIEKQKSKKLIEELRNKIKVLKERNASLQDVEGQCSALLKQRDQESLEKERIQKKKLYKENEALRNEQNRLEQQLKTVDFDRNEIDQKNIELVSLRKKFKIVEEKLTFSLEDNTILQSDIDRVKKHLEETKNQLSESEARYIGVGSKSDTEKENATLRLEVSDAVKDVVTIREQYGVLSNQCDEQKKKLKIEIENLQQDNLHLEHEKSDLKAKLESLQQKSNLFKSNQLGKKNLYDEKMENLVQQKLQLENDKGRLGNKVYSLENEKIEIQERSERLEYERTCLENIRSENEGLKASLAVCKSELEEYKEKQVLKMITKMVEQYKIETAIRISTDGITKQNQDENDRLRKERNSARNELHRVIREKEDISKHFNAEVNIAKAEYETKDREKSELLDLFKMEKGRLELEIETLKSRLVAGAAQHGTYEVMQLKQDLETCKLQKKSVENDRDDLQKDIVELEKQLQSRSMNSSLRELEDERNTDNLQRQIKDFEDRYNNATTELHKAEKKIKDLNEVIKKQEEENRDVNVKLIKSEKEKKDLENRLRFSGSQIQVELDRKKEELDVLRGRLLTDEEKVVQSRKEKNTLQRENEDLKQTLNNLSRQLKQSEDSLRSPYIFVFHRFKELLDSKQSSQVLQNQVQDLHKDISELNKRIKNSKEENIGIQKENTKLKEDVQKLFIQLEESVSRLKISKDETSSFQKNNAELERLLQEKSKQLKSLDARFRDISGSIENAEDLQRRINTLELEMSQLNTKLSVIKDENLTLQKDNKDLKNRVQEKSKQLKTAEERLQENSREFEGMHSLKRRLENLQTDNAELENRCRHKDGLLQKADSNAQKMKKDHQELQTQMISQKQNYDTLKNKLESFKDKNIELEDRLRRRSPVVVAEPKNCQNCFKYRNDISDLKREINDLRDRLSEAAGNKLRDNNPNIADLSDMNRPTSLAEKFSSLYTDEYTDAMEVIEDAMDEAASVKVMLDWLKKCYEWCQRLAKEQRETLINRSIGFMQEHGGQKVVLSDRCLIFVKEFQKKIAVESLAVVGQICHVKSVTQQTLSSENYIVKYIKKCSELCWMMQISDPPLYLNFDVNSGENLNKNDYNVFTKSGSKIDYLVWPVLYLHKTGPMLAKGVAQGK
ncbi:GRIP and coiled-coil domain-containing protein 2-like [Mytilus trossulus]|uniref:GRIP and coiled-coil domain-containing protein 2-like n=1 Tax=Mytilus trossulus TaxID=6551 RepID=UPI003005BC9F